MSISYEVAPETATQLTVKEVPLTSEKVGVAGASGVGVVKD